MKTVELGGGDGGKEGWQGGRGEAGGEKED